MAWQFDRKGIITVGGGDVDEDAVFEAAVEAGADDVGSEDGEFVVTTGAADLHEVRQALAAAGLTVTSAELAMVAKSEVGVGGREGERLLKLLHLLDDHDDVQQVHSNADLNESVLASAR